jgi:hypothetical protein
MKALPPVNAPVLRPSRLLIRFLSWMVLGFAMIESLHSVLAWWREGTSVLTVGQWILLGLFPVLLFIYVWYFSIFRRDCPRCAVDQDTNTPP